MGSAICFSLGQVAVSFEVSVMAFRQSPHKGSLLFFALILLPSFRPFFVKLIEGNPFALALVVALVHLSIVGIKPFFVYEASIQRNGGRT
jgi:hypothetical protein